MEFKGTKGEWVVQDKFRSPRVINESGQVIFEHKTDCYDTTDDSHVYYSHNKMIANAKLIAAAPDLLRALKVFVDFPEEDLNGWIDEGAPVIITVQSSHLYNAINAIEKALK